MPVFVKQHRRAGSIVKAYLRKGTPATKAKKSLDRIIDRNARQAFRRQNLVGRTRENYSDKYGLLTAKAYKIGKAYEARNEELMLARDYFRDMARLKARVGGILLRQGERNPRFRKGKYSRNR